METVPEKNSLWMHYKGGLYVVLDIGRLESTLEKYVIYRKAEDPDGPIWLRSVRNWFGEIEGFGPRFKPSICGRKK